jgi:hypothetical protein
MAILSLRRDFLEAAHYMSIEASLSIFIRQTVSIRPNCQVNAITEHPTLADFDQARSEGADDVAFSGGDSSGSSRGNLGAFGTYGTRPSIA